MRHKSKKTLGLTKIENGFQNEMTYFVVCVRFFFIDNNLSNSTTKHPLTYIWDMSSSCVSGFWLEMYDLSR